MNIMQDMRKIKRLYYEDESYIEAIDGKEIIPYEENGEMALVVWFKIIDKNGVIIERVNSKYIQTIQYDLKE